MRSGTANAEQLRGPAERPAPPPAASHARFSPVEEDLQVAARLKLLLSSGGRITTVTGLAAADGATILTVRLGAALASIDRRPVAVVDGNFHGSGMQDLVGIPPGPGLLDLLAGQAGLNEAIYPAGNSGNLFFIPAGSSPSGAAALLSSLSGIDAMRILRERFSYLLIDAGPVLRSPSGMLLGSFSDGVLAAVAAGAHTRRELAQFREELRRLHLALLGIVLTRGTAR